MLWCPATLEHCRRNPPKLLEDDYDNEHELDFETITI